MNRLLRRKIKKAPRNDVNCRGFTLFELLVSISIIGILTALAIVSYSSAQKKARDARRIQDLQAISKAAEQYYMLNNSAYPVAGLYTAGIGWSVAGGQKVLESFPLDPKGVGYSTTGWITDTTKYCICGYMEGQKGNSNDQSCSYGVGTTANAPYYCVSNQQ